MRKVDITEKLTFDENPVLVIKGKELEINADAPTMLKVMGLIGKEDPGAEEVVEAYELIFADKAKKEIDSLKLSFSDLMVAVREAVTLISGVDDSLGEQ